MSVSVESEQFALLVLSPDGEAFSGSAGSLRLQTRAGEIEILPRHEPLLAILSPGPVFVRRTRDQDELLCAVTGGFLVVTDSLVTLLADGIQRQAPGDTP